jgi:hypothetical protein
MITSSLDRAVCASRSKYCMEGGNILVRSLIHLLRFFGLPCICASVIMFHDYNHYCYEFMIDSPFFSAVHCSKFRRISAKGTFLNSEMNYSFISYEVFTWYSNVLVTYCYHIKCRGRIKYNERFGREITPTASYTGVALSIFGSETTNLGF